MAFSEHVILAYRMLAAARVVSRQRLMDELEISRSTLTRVISFLRDRLRQEIVHDDDLGGYVLRRPQPGTEAELTMIPGLWLSAEEAYDLLRLLNSVRALDPGLLLRSNTSLRMLIKQMLSGRGFAFQGVNRRVRFELPTASAHGRLQLAKISIALSRDRQVDLTPRQGGAALKGVSPQYVVLRPDGWHLCIYAAGWPGEKHFHIDDVKDVKVLDSRAVRKSGIDDDYIVEEERALRGELGID